MGYKPEKNDGSFVNGIIMSSARPGAWVETVVRSLVESEKRGVCRQKEYSITYASMVETTTR